MAVCGVIAEHDPFHRGHMWQLMEIRRRLGADTAVVTVMSGNFVQRGELALCGKHARAEMALMGGADLVLELPAPWSCATAEIFARGGVSLLSATGVVTHLAFGCECGALEPLRAAAACLDSEAYRAGVARFTGEGMTFAAARQAAARALLERQGNGAAAECLSSPNNNLGVEYLRALTAWGSDMEPIALPRVGEGHHSDAPGPLASASAVRRRVLAGEDWRDMVPETTAAILDRELAAGRAPVALARCERAVLARLRAMSEEDFRPYDGGGEGLYHRFYDGVRRACSIEELLERVKTKRYPMARLRRMLLHSYLGLVPARPEQRPPCLRVLGANERGRALLRDMRKKASLPVLVKPADVRKLGEAAASLLAREGAWTDLYTLAYPDLAQALPGREFAQSPVMLERGRPRCGPR